MSKAGDVAENPVTGELLVAELFVRPGGAVAGEHMHPTIDEWFTVLEGRVGFRLDGWESVASAGERLHVPPGTVHDWWNVGEEEARVVVEVSPAARFEEAVSNTFGLARDGKTDAKGMPNLLQVSLIAREFEDLLYFTSPPRPVQRVLFAVLAPVARFLGLQGQLLRVPEPAAGREGRGRVVAGVGRGGVGSPQPSGWRRDRPLR